MSTSEARILVVGAGAVGQCYGYYLSRGGAELSFLVKAKYKAELEQGLTVYPLNKSRWKPQRLEGFGVLDSMAEVAQQTWNQVWLCVASTALNDDWLAELAQAVGDATLVSFTPGLEDRSRICAHFPEEQVVQGMIPFMSFQAPLEGMEKPHEPGVAWYIPPFSPTPLTGEAERRDWAIWALERGGAPVASHVDVGQAAAAAAAVFQPYLVALELADWRFAGLRRHPDLKLAKAAGDEALAVVRDFHGQLPRLPGLLNRPLTVSVATRFAPLLIPYDMETFLKYHFSKVAAQTSQMLATWCRQAEARGLEHSSLSLLAEKLSEWRARPASGG